MDRYLTNQKLSPTQVITIYNDRAKNNYYLEHRHVKSVNGRFTLMAPAPLGEDVFRNIAQAFVKEKTIALGFGAGIIPEHILYGYNELGKTVVIWWRPVMKRALNFSGNVIKVEGDAVANLPATLYVLVDAVLYIYALMDDNRPTAETKLYHAPFFNIYSDGRVCMGTARVGKRTKTYDGEAERYERAFYMAEQNGGQSERACKTPLSKLWPGLIKSGKPFPSKAELQQHGQYRTLGILIDKLIGKNRNHDNR